MSGEGLRDLRTERPFGVQSPDEQDHSDDQQSDSQSSIHTSSLLDYLRRNRTIPARKPATNVAPPRIRGIVICDRTFAPSSRPSSASFPASFTSRLALRLRRPVLNAILCMQT